MTDLIASEIFDNLFLGGYTIANDTKQLKEKGITKVLTVMDLQNGPNYNPEEFIHKRFNITDNSQQNIIQYFGECINFIKGNEKILIHCLKGTSRSATIVIAYLMWYKKWKFEETYDFVKSKRFIYPNKGLIVYQSCAMLDTDGVVRRFNWKIRPRRRICSKSGPPFRATMKEVYL